MESNQQIFQDQDLQVIDAQKSAADDDDGGGGPLGIDRAAIFGLGAGAFICCSSLLAWLVGTGCFHSVRVRVRGIGRGRPSVHEEGNPSQLSVTTGLAIAEPFPEQHELFQVAQLAQTVLTGSKA